jgi:hypothetical protein
LRRRRSFRGLRPRPALAQRVAVDAIAEDRRRRSVARAREITADVIRRDLHAAGVAERAEVVAKRVVDDLEARPVAGQRDVAAQIAARYPARIADELLKAHVAVDTNGVELDEVGPARLETAADSRVARDQRAAGEYDYVASDVSPAELTASGDIERAAQIASAEARCADPVSCVVSVASLVFVVLCVGALTLKHDRRHDGGK